jgi:regulator of sigma E protease
MVGSPASVASRDEIPSGGKLEDVQVTVVDLLSGAPAQRAGIKVGDAVLEINGQSILTVPDMQGIVATSPGTPLAFQIKRADKIVDIAVTPDKNSETGKGSTGVVISLVGKLSYPWYKAPVIGAYNTWQALTSILKGLGGLFTGSIGVKQLGGPAKIAQLTGEASKLGMAYLLQFTAFLSLNLAVLNVLPFPALDGGRVLFLLIEKLRRKPNNQTVEQAFNLVGFSLLILLMLVVTFNDIRGFGGLGTILGKIF